jgi:hypothetical protein
MKKTVLLVFVLILTSQFFAQTKLVALKFDEFDDTSEVNFYPYEGFCLSERIERFISQIKKESGKRIYIVYYKAQKTDKGNENKSYNLAEQTRWKILDKTKLEREDVILIDGGYREKNTLEYWIAPKNAEPPKPTSGFDTSESIVCPNIYVQGDGFEYDRSKIVKFSVYIYQSEPKKEFTYKWKTSDGKILNGQSTDAIDVDLSNTNTKTVSAFVEIEGVPYSCGKVGFTKIEIGKNPYIFDSAVRYNYSDLLARLEAFITFLNNNPTTRGYIIVYANRTEGSREMERAIASVKRVFAFRKQDLSRVTMVRGGYREYNTVDSWILPEGADVPIPTPTVAEKFIKSPAKKKTIRKRR